MAYGLQRKSKVNIVKAFDEEVDLLNLLHRRENYVVFVPQAALNKPMLYSLYFPSWVVAAFIHFFF